MCMKLVTLPGNAKSVLDLPAYGDTVDIYTALTMTVFEL